MGNIVISVENLSKTYRLGQIGTGTFSRDLEVWWARMRGKSNPLLKIGEKDHGNRDGETLWALKDVSFTVEQGEVLGIIGRNGAGKSTLLKILSRVTAPTSGQVKVKGRIASLLEVGTGFHPELTGRENIFLNGAILGMTREEVRRKFDEIVAFAEIEKFIDTPVKRYSSGMYVRLAFAVAAHLESEILLVDEVLAVGDAEFQKKCLGKMGDVASKEGRTVLFVSHNMIAIEQLCVNGILLANGRISHYGNIKNVITQYLNQSTSTQSAIYELEGKNKLIIIKDINTVGKNGNPVKAIRIGDDLIFQLRIYSKEYISVLKIGLGINNNYNLRIATLHNSVSGFSLSLKEGENTVSCMIPKIHLVEGTYYLDIKIYSTNEPILECQNFFQFQIQSGNIYSSGKLPDPSWGGVCYLNQYWDINN